MNDMRAPFIWFGGKSRVAPLIWDALGDVEHYVEPFFGSGAVLLARPHPARCETVNDADVLRWCAANGANPDLRIVLAGYDGEHNDLEALGWRVHAWSTAGGYGAGRGGRGDENARKERLWFSPHCVDDPAQGRLL